MAKVRTSLKRRPTPKGKPSGWITKPVRLSNQRKTDLLHFLGRKEGGKGCDGIIREIEGILGEFLPATRNLDMAPRPTHRLAEIEPLLQSVEDTFNRLTSLSWEATEDITYVLFKLAELYGGKGDESQSVKGLKDLIQRLKMDLATFGGALSSSKEILDREGSRHGRTKEGLKVTALLLKKVFENYFKSKHSDMMTIQEKFQDFRDFFDEAMAHFADKGYPQKEISLSTQELSSLYFSPQT